MLFRSENKLINMDDDINNNVLNTILYKIYFKLNLNDKEIELEKIKIKNLIDNYSKNKFRDLLELYDSI